MKVFKDKNGVEWLIEINVDAVKKVKGLAGVDLLDIADGKLMERLMSDPILLVDVLWCLCKEQAASRGVNDEQFGKVMGGDAIDAATTAMLEELVDFFPLRKRQVLAKAFAKVKTIEARVIDLANVRLDSPTLDAKIEKALATLGDSSGDAPQSPVESSAA